MTNTTYYGEVGEVLSIRCADNGTIDTVQWYIVGEDDRVPVLSKKENIIAIKYNTPVVRDIICQAQNYYETVTNTFKVVIT